MRVRYVGRKNPAQDSLYGTQAIWEGPGDVVVIDDDAVARRMCQNHPDQYEIVPEDWEEPKYVPPEVTEAGTDALDIMVEEAGQPVPLRAAKWVTVMAYARKQGLLVPNNLSQEQLLGAISEQMAMRDRFHMNGEAAGEPSSAAGTPLSVIPDVSPAPGDGLQPVELMQFAAKADRMAAEVDAQAEADPDPF